MNKRTTGALAALAVTVAGAVTGVALTPGVHADSTAPWQAASLKSPNAVGTIALLDASGNPVTSGPIGEPLAAYAVASGGLRAGDTVASLAVVTPLAQVTAAKQLAQDSNDDPSYAAWKASAANGPDTWTGYPVAAPTKQTGLPAFATGPTVALADSVTLQQYLAGYASTLSADGYRNVYELRLSTGAPGRGFDPSYAVLDLEVNGDTWHLYGEGGPQATATTTTLEAAPAGAKVGQPVTLTATVSPTAAGTVQFKAAGANVGAAVTVDGTGRATTTWTPASAGSVPLSAVFTPADASAFAGSTGTATYAVSAVAPTVTATWPAFRYGASSTVRVTVASTPAATGTVGIVYAGRVVASAAVSGGVAAVKVPATALPAGSRSLVARFTSSAPAKVASRDSAARTVSVAKAVAKVANTTVPKTVKRSRRTTFVFSVTAPGTAVTGTVKVYDGTKVVATVAVRSGRATVRLALKKGKHSIKAAFLGNANVAAATGAAVKVTSK